MAARKAARMGASAIVWLMVAAGLGALAFLGIGPRVDGYRTLTVLTGSMRPTMPPGSMIVVAREPAADLRVGDVLVYQIPVLDHRVVSHRVVAISRDGSGIVVRTKGDANDAPDPWIARITDATVWRARFAVPYLGAVVRVLRSPGVHRTVLFAVPLALAMMWLLDIWRPEPAPSPGNA